MKKLSLLLFGILILILNGCGGDNGKPITEQKKSKPTKPKVINGYTLPPEPDPKINNATLLGVDSNHNGVRDDVERYIIKRYKDYHKAVTQIGFQFARAYQKILANPLNTKENHKALSNALDCNFYFRYDGKRFGDKILVDHYINDTFKSMQLNTKSRLKAYIAYDRELSGGVYGLTPSHQEKSKCSEEVLKVLKVKK